MTSNWFCDKIFMAETELYEIDRNGTYMRKEIFAIPCVGAIIEKVISNEKYILIQTRQKLSFQPFCITQNLSGAYSIILNTFLCEAEGNLRNATNETENVHWIRAVELRQMLNETPEKIFFMHVNALKKYFDR